MAADVIVTAQSQRPSALGSLGTNKKMWKIAVLGIIALLILSASTSSSLSTNLVFAKKHHNNGLSSTPAPVPVPTSQQCISRGNGMFAEMFNRANVVHGTCVTVISETPMSVIVTYPDRIGDNYGESNSTETEALVNIATDALSWHVSSHSDNGVTTTDTLIP